MPDHPEWPPTPRGLYAGARTLAYLMIAVAGLDVSFGRVTTTGQSTSVLWIDIIGVLAGVAGATAVVGTIFRRWQVEWVAVAVLTSTLLLYTIFDWYVLLFIVGYPPLSVALVALLGGVAVFSAVATGKRRWRWAAISASVLVLAMAIPIAARNPAIVTATTALLGGRFVELWLFSDEAVRARRMRPGARPEFDT